MSSDEWHAGPVRSCRHFTTFWHPQRVLLLSDSHTYCRVGGEVYGRPQASANAFCSVRLLLAVGVCGLQQPTNEVRNTGRPSQSAAAERCGACAGVGLCPKQVCEISQTQTTSAVQLLPNSDIWQTQTPLPSLPPAGTHLVCHVAEMEVNQRQCRTTANSNHPRQLVEVQHLLLAVLRALCAIGWCSAYAAPICTTWLCRQ